jgi:YggT family protein
MRFLVLLIDGYSLVLLAAVILSWIQLPQDHPLVRFLRAATEPVLGPVRRMLPDMGGFDLSPMLVFAGLRLLRSVLLR